MIIYNFSVYFNSPFCGSKRPSIISAVVVFPLPVAPTNPTVEQLKISRLILVNDV